MLGIESSLPSASRASKRRSSKSFRPSLKAASGLKISTMLMICMGLFMVLIVAVGGLAAYFLQQSGDALRTINRQSDRAVQVLQLSNNMMEARLGLMSAARFYQEAGIDNDANTLQSADNLVIMANQKLDEVRKAFADIRANMPTEPELRRLAMGFVASYQAYLDDGIEPMVQALETRDYSTFYFVSEGFGVLRAATFQFRIEELSKFYNDQTDLLLEQAQLQTRVANSAIGLGLLIGLAIIVALRLVLGRTALAPLREAGVHFDHIANGDLTKKITYRSANEVGVLYDAMRRMQQSL